LLTVPLILVGAAFCLGWAYALGRIALCRLPTPWEAALGIGAAIQSSLVFALLSFGLASREVFLGLGAVSMLAAWRFRGASLKDPATPAAPRAVWISFVVILAVYGVFYFVNALAPETQADGTSYHLGFAAEYNRTGEFPDRVGFFEMVPQGVEMLFTVAYAIGKYSAGKLVHFGFLLATVPLVVRIGRRLRLNDCASIAAAGIYFCAPITGVSGTCAYNDAALVFYVLLVLYLLLVWRDQGNDWYLLPAGIAAGFCYAIKFTGIIVLPLAMLAALIAARRLRPLILLAVGVLMIAPWMGRDAAMTGNPVAPLFNRWFPNPYFNAATEDELAKSLRSYEVPKPRIPWELAIGGNLQGIYGPLLFAMPLGLLALRQREGRWLWLAAVALAVPWFWNIGARFLMPAFVFALLAFVMALPRAAALVCLAVQAITCWPQVIELYNNADMWRLREFPWQAALRIEPEPRYLADHMQDYAMVETIQKETRPGDRIYSLESVPWAYSTREFLEYWHSSQGERFVDWLKNASFYNDAPVYDVSAAWNTLPLRALRFRINTAHPGEWYIHEVVLEGPDGRLRNSPRWALSGWPNDWEMTYAFDGNISSRWRTWTPMRPGMFLQVDLDRPQLLSGATLISHTPVYEAPMEFYGMDASGRWLSFGIGKAVRRPWEDMRRPTIRAIKREGYRYLLVPTGKDALGPVGEDIVRHEVEWGVVKVADSFGSYLFRIP
jgi:hypothetical protein